MLPAILTDDYSITHQEFKPVIMDSTIHGKIEWISSAMFCTYNFGIHTVARERMSNSDVGTHIGFRLVLDLE